MQSRKASGRVCAGWWKRVLALAALAGAYCVYGQSNPAREYIYLGGRLVAIESSGFSAQLSSVDANFTAAASTASVGVTFQPAYSGAWKITAKPDWVSGIDLATSYTGPQTVSFNVEANPTTQDRTGTMVIAGRDFTVRQSACTLALGAYALSLGSGAESGQIAAATVCGGLTVDSTVTWATPSWMVTAQERKLRVDVSANSGPQRTGTVRILSGATVLQTVEVTQDAPAGPSPVFSISPARATFQAMGDAGQVRVSGAAGVWQVTNGASWITGPSGSYSGDQTWAYIVQPNSGSSRTAAVTFGSLVFTVDQAGCAVALGAPSAAFPAAGGSTTLGFETGCASVTASANQSWVKISTPTKTAGSAWTLGFTVDPNPGAQRAAAITVNGQTFSVTQAAVSTSLSPQSQLVAAAGQSGLAVRLVSPAGYTISTPAEVTITATSGLGTADNPVVFTYSVQANTGPGPRAITWVIAGMPFVIQQLAPAPVTPQLALVEAQPLPAGASTNTVTVTVPAGYAWQATTATPWIHLGSPYVGTGSGQFRFSLDPNGTGAQRSGSIQVGLAQLTVTQGFCNFAITKLEITPNVAYEAGIGAVVQFNALIDGQVRNSDVTWSTVGGGSISSTGLFTNPTGGAMTINILATCKCDPRYQAGAVAMSTQNPYDWGTTRVWTTGASGRAGGFYFSTNTAANGYLPLPMHIMFRNDSTDVTNACYLRVLPGGGLGLLADDGMAEARVTSYYYAMPMRRVVNPYTSNGAPRNYMEANSQCLIDWNRSPDADYVWYDYSTSNLVYNMPLYFAPAFAGAKTIFYRRTENGTTGAWGPVQSSSWTVPAGSAPSGALLWPAADGQSVAAGAVIQGWAYGANGIDVTTAKVKVYVNGDFVGDAQYGAALNPAPAGCTTDPACPNIGFKFTLPTTLTVGSTYLLQVVATEKPAVAAPVPAKVILRRMIYVNQATPPHSVTPAAQSVAAAGQQGLTIQVSSQKEWSVSGAPAWVSNVTPMDGIGNATITYSVAANDGPARTATLAIGGASMTISQAGCALSFGAAPAFNAAGGSGSVAVTSACAAWTAASNAAWLTITAGASGSGNGTVSFSVAANTGGDRTATVTVSGQTFTVKQSAPPPVLAPAAQSAPAAGQNGLTIGVTALGAWSVSGTPPWVTGLTPGSGTGNATISYNVAANAGDARTATFVIGGTGFALSQACTVTLSGTGAAYGLAAGTGSFTVTPGCVAWTATTTDNWLTVTSAPGVSPVTFSFTALASGTRTGTITVVDKTFTVTQAGTPVLTPASASIAAAGKTGNSIAVQSVLAWTVTGTPAWVTGLTPTSGSGNGTITYNVTANGGAARSATLNVGGTNFVLSQACTVTLSAAAASVGAGAAAGSVQVTPGCSPWTATSNAAWLTITANASGTGAAAVQYSAAANPGAQRTGVITVADKTLTVTQAGISAAVTPAVNYLGTPTGTVAVTAGAGQAWTAVAGTYWIRITAGASGTGNGTVSFTADSDGTARTGTITVGSAVLGYTTVTVQQSPCWADPATLAVSPASGSLGFYDTVWPVRIQALVGGVYRNNDVTWALVEGEGTFTSDADGAYYKPYSGTASVRISATLQCSPSNSASASFWIYYWY